MVELVVALRRDVLHHVFEGQEILQAVGEMQHVALGACLHGCYSLDVAGDAGYNYAVNRLYRLECRP